MTDKVMAQYVLIIVFHTIERTARSKGLLSRANCTNSLQVSLKLTEI